MNHKTQKIGNSHSGGPSGSRLICVDDNIRSVGDRHFEFANLLLEGAEQLGLQPVLATNACFDGKALVDPAWPLARVFNTCRMARWSLGIDGNSKTCRDLAGKPIGGTSVQNIWTQMTDKISRPGHRPETMLGQWADDLSSLLMLCKPTSDDSLLINSGDDFVMLALAAAMRRLNLPFSLRIDVIFHFEVHDRSREGESHLDQFGRQMNYCLDALKPHSVNLHTTSDPLSVQMGTSSLQQPVNSIPYPIRTRVNTANPDPSWPMNIVLADAVRAGDDRESITSLLQRINQPLLQTGKARLSLRLPEENWEAIVPKSLQARYRQTVARSSSVGHASDMPLEVMTPKLPVNEYHRWLNDSDAGLFLQSPDQYGVRCNPELLELMVRGVPVIVPEGCCLADQVRAANTHAESPIGFVYQDRQDVPELLAQLVDQRETIQALAIRYATTVAARHQATNTIRELGIPTPPIRQRVA